MSDQNISPRLSSNSTDSALKETMSLVIGRVISLFVHETNNHLATLRESSGLGDDIISAKNLTDREKLKELEKLLRAMDNRTGHAASLVRTFGELGRHMENPSGTIDINQVIEGVMPFLIKLARQKNLKIRTSYGRNLPTAAGDFFSLQCLIFALFENICIELEPSATATMTTDKTKSAVFVRFTADCTTAEDSEKKFLPWETLEAFAAANGFEIMRYQQGGAVTITIRKQD